MFEQFNYQDLKIKLEEVINSTSLDSEGERNMRFINEYLDTDRLLDSFKKVLDTKL